MLDTPTSDAAKFTWLDGWAIESKRFSAGGTDKVAYIHYSLVPNNRAEGLIKLECTIFVIHKKMGIKEALHLRRIRQKREVANNCVFRHFFKVKCAH